VIREKNRGAGALEQNPEHPQICTMRFGTKQRLQIAETHRDQK